MTYRAYIILAFAIFLAACRKEDPCYGPPGPMMLYTPKYFVGDTVEFNQNNGTATMQHWDSHGTGIFVESGTTICDAVAPHFILVSGNNVVEASVTNECGTGTWTVNIPAEPHYPGTWTQMADMNIVRGDGISFSIGTKVYVGAGTSTGFETDFWEWDQTSNVWTQRADMPRPCVEGISFSMNGKGYFGLGLGSAGMEGDMWEWDPSTNIWTQKSDYPGGKRQGPFVFTIGNYAYVGTGDSLTGHYTKDFYRYDPVTDTWLSRGSLANGLTFACSFSVNGKGYICGGYQQPWTGCAEVWEYDPVSNTWTQKNSFMRDVYLGTGFSIGNKGYMTCPLNYTSEERRSLSTFEYDPGSDTWQYKHGCPGGPRSGTMAAVIGGSAYIAGGLAGDGYTNEFWEFTP